MTSDEINYLHRILNALSNQTVLISGQPVNVTIPPVTANVSGQPVSISGQAVLISGQPVIISGQPVTTSVSGQPVSISGQAVLISGQPVTTSVSGQEIAITPILIADIHNTTITPNSSILSNSVTPNKNVSLFRVQAAMTFAGVLSVSTSQANTSGSVYPTAFNQKGVLVSSCMYIFDHEVHSGEVVNYSYSTSSLVINFHVQEMPGGVY